MGAKDFKILTKQNMANEKIDTTQNIITPPVWDHEKEEDLLAALESIPEEDIMRMWAKMDETERRKKEERIDALKWDTDAILKDLRKNYVKIEENAEMMWYKWKKVHIDLPAVWNFEWFKFDYFVSDKTIKRETFESNPELEKKSYSMKDISKLLQAMDEYMSELQGKNDGERNYENEQKFWETDVYRCNAWDCLKSITWLNSRYWLSDKNIHWKKIRAIWTCISDGCCFITGDAYFADTAPLLLRLTD